MLSWQDIHVYICPYSVTKSKEENLSMALRNLSGYYIHFRPHKLIQGHCVRAATLFYDISEFKFMFIIFFFCFLFCFFSFFLSFIFLLSYSFFFSFCFSFFFCLQLHFSYLLEKISSKSFGLPTERLYFEFMERNYPVQ